MHISMLSLCVYYDLYAFTHLLPSPVGGTNAKFNLLGVQFYIAGLKYVPVYVTV